MSEYKALYNLGPFGIEVISDDSAVLDECNRFLYQEDEKQLSDILKLRVFKSSNILQQIISECSTKDSSIMSGYMKTKLLHGETADFVYNYDANKNVAVVHNKQTGEVDIISDENSPEFHSLPMYIIREMIMRKHENLGNTILHSSSIANGDTAYAIVGGPGAGKTSLLLALMKSGKTRYISNDINFITPDNAMLYPFEIPMLLSDETAKSYFPEDDTALADIPTITYFHQKDQKQITKYKLSRNKVQDIFGVNTVNGCKLGGIIIPRFLANKKGIGVEILNANIAEEIIGDQILDKDDRFATDYLGLGTTQYKRKDYILDPLIEGTPILRITYGKDIFHEQNISALPGVFKFLHRASNKGFEIHCHSTCSDGFNTPEELVDIAIQNNLTTLSITDHNTVEGVRRAKDYINKNNIDLELVDGVEIDANDLSCLHILGYGIQDLDGIEEFLNRFERQNDDILRQIIKNLARLGVDISEEQVLNHFKTDKLTKQRIGNYLIANGYAENSSEVTQKYLGKHCPSYIPRIQPTAKEVIDIISKCGGVSVIAHPMELMKYNPQLATEQDVLNYIKELQRLGLDGVECCTHKHTVEQESMLYYFCEANGLISTIGNDYHGRPNQKFGTQETDLISNLRLRLSELESDRTR